MTAVTESQRRAIDARGNVLVVAGAGTGKTSTLVQRCMALLGEGGSLENILMVTFTEAAAAEMRSRIRESLHARITELTEENPPSLQREHFEKQLALLDTARISTLHGFCLQLVREHFYELGIDPDLTVLDEQQTRPVIEQLLDAIFERHYAGDSDTARAVQSLVRVQGRGLDERIRGLVLKLHRYAQSLVNPAQWLDEQQAVFSSAQPDRWRQWLVEGFSEWRDLWLPELKTFAGNPAVDQSLAALQSIAPGESFEPVAAAVRSIHQADQVDSNWPRGSIGEVRDRLKGFFADVDFLVSLLPGNGTDPLAEDWELVRRDMSTLLHLTREFGGEFSRVKREMGGADFSDLEQFALRVLRDPRTGSATPTARQWQRQLHYVFVDEYQDINAAQDAILSSLSREGVESNRFLVGDMKQSIYRFRLADAAIFRGYERRWNSVGPESQRISLVDNFRSRPGILDFVNPLFEALMRESVGGVNYEPLRAGGITAGSAAGQPPCVELHVIARSETDGARYEANTDEPQPGSEVADLLVTEREARLVGLRLLQLKEQKHEILDKAGQRLRPVEWRDMAVLMRSPSTRVEAFAKEFAALGIPLEAARGGFFESSEISDLVSLLKLLDNPLQDIPLLAVLRSPLVGLSVRDLAEVRAQEQAGDRARYFWLAARQFCRRIGASNPVGQKLNAFFTRLDRWRQLIRHASLSHCLEIALSETHYEILLRAGIRGEQQLANVRRLLDLAREYDPYQRQGLFRFLRFIKAQEEMETELEAAPENQDAVRLMSIHRSKGLEFPIVVVAGLAWQFNFRDLHETILLDEHYGLCPKISPEGSDQHYPSLPHWLARRRQRRELLGEELRLLYVAMTRARDSLLLAATSTSKSDPDWASEERRAVTDRELLSARNYFDWLKLWLSHATQPGDWTDNRSGQTPLLRWTIYQENDDRLALPKSAAVSTVDAPVSIVGDSSVDPDLILQLQRRLNWIYPFKSATEQKAKASVTEIRRQNREEEAEAAHFIRRNRFALSDSARSASSGTRPVGPTRLTAAEIGLAHHLFLERLSLSKTGSVEELRAEADRLRRDQWLSELEMASLNFPALAEFWQSDIGYKITSNAPAVRRELQFTAGLSAIDLVESKLEAPSGLPLDEWVVVQGMVDLAVILPEEIWIVDFKTDAVDGDFDLKVKTYEPQLKLYALALTRIYNRPVTDCRLYFLSGPRMAKIKV